MLATFGGNLWIKLFWYLELLRKTWIHFSVLDFFEYLNGKGNKCRSTSMEQNCRGRKGFSQSDLKDLCPAWGSQLLFVTSPFYSTHEFPYQDPKLMTLQHILYEHMPYEKKAQKFRRENDGSAFFLAEPFFSPWWISSKWKVAGPEMACWLVFLW